VLDKKVSFYNIATHRKIYMDIDKLKSMFIVSANENLIKFRQHLDLLEKDLGSQSKEQVSSLYILSHSIRSMSVFLPIYRITLVSKDMESKIKLWQEPDKEVTNEDVRVIREEFNILQNMIEHLDDYLDE